MPSQINPVHNITHSFRKISFNILSTPMSTDWSVPFRLFYLSFVRTHFSSSHVCNMIVVSHPRCYQPNNICWLVACYKLWSISLCSFLQPPVTSFLLGPNIFPSILFSNTLNLCSSRNVRDHVSRPYKITGKIIAYFCVFWSLNISIAFGKTADSEMRGNKHSRNWSLLLIFSWVQFWFVIVVSNYFDFATFSKDLFSCLCNM
jgi:hypothetical protein